MTAYLGPLGSLVPFKCPSDEQLDRAAQVSLSTTLAGVQKAQRALRAPRAWQVGIGTATPGELAGLLGLLEGLYGPPPWVYVGPWAQVTNLLNPDASLLRPGTWSGNGVAGDAAELDNGMRPQFSVVSETGEDMRVPAVPVVPGTPVTCSAWATGPTTVIARIDFRSATRATVGTKEITHEAPLGAPLRRVAVTMTPPPTAVDVVFTVRRSVRTALPAVTWTSEMADWSPGQGAPKVIATGLSQAVQLASRGDRLLRRSSASFVLEEVGNA